MLTNSYPPERIELCYYLYSVWSILMSTDGNQTPPALKHGAFSKTAILPGEDATAFEQLHEDLIAELSPNGALEEDIVVTIARLIWRKGNFVIFRSAELARKRCDAKASSVDGGASLMAKLDAARDGVVPGEQAGEFFSIERIQDRVDSMIEKCITRLLFLRGLKSLPAAVPPRSPRPAIAESPRTGTVKCRLN